MAHIHPQEIYLLERFSSAAYFNELRDTWAAMIRHVELCLARFTSDLPADYRSRPLPEQPEAVWGERVLPNFRYTLQGLDTACVKLAQGELDAIAASYGPLSDFKGQMDAWSGWMSKADDLVYGELLAKAVMLAGNIAVTDAAGWDPTALGPRYHEPSRGPLAAPAAFPAYQVDPQVQVASGSKVRRSGIYVPDAAGASAQFLSTAHDEAPPARVLAGILDLIAHDGNKYAEVVEVNEVACQWLLVTRR